MTLVAFITVISIIPIIVYTVIKLGDAFDMSDFVKALTPAVLWILWLVFSYLCIN